MTYFSAGTSFYTKASGGTSVTGLSDLCGLTVAVEKRHDPEGRRHSPERQVHEGRKEPVKVLVFNDQNGANLALASGRAQVVMADSPVAAYAGQEVERQFKIVGQTYGAAPYGLAMSKASGLTSAVLAACQEADADGQYKRSSRSGDPVRRDHRSEDQRRHELTGSFQ